MYCVVQQVVCGYKRLDTRKVSATLHLPYHEDETCIMIDNATQLL